MNNRKNALSALINQLVSPKSSILGTAQFFQSLVNASSGASKSGTSSASLGSLGLRSSSAGSVATVKGIQFGKPSNNTTSSSAPSGSTWKGLLTQTASGGLASALPGGLSSIAGLGDLISNIGKIFGGSSKPAPPPLVLFSLPNSVQQTAYLTSKGTGLYAVDAMEKAVKPGATSAIYTTGGLPNETSHNVSTIADSAAIAQAVKNALLTSNTLGDVISEL